MVSSSREPWQPTATQFLTDKCLASRMDSTDDSAKALRSTMTMQASANALFQAWRRSRDACSVVSAEADLRRPQWELLFRHFDPNRHSTFPSPTTGGALSLGTFSPCDRRGFTKGTVFFNCATLSRVYSSRPA